MSKSELTGSVHWPSLSVCLCEMTSVYDLVSAMRAVQWLKVCSLEVSLSGVSTVVGSTYYRAWIMSSILFLFCAGSLVAWKQEQVSHNGDSGSPTTPFPVSLPEQGNGLWLPLHQRGTVCPLHTDRRIMYMPFIKRTKLNADYQTKSKMSSNWDINLISVSMALD